MIVYVLRVMSMTTVTHPELPELPQGMRWKVTHRRDNSVLELQRAIWCGWKTLQKCSVNPVGMGILNALVSASFDLLDRDTVTA